LPYLEMQQPAANAGRPATDRARPAPAKRAERGRLEPLNS
jgi:hypothetical protein